MNVLRVLIHLLALRPFLRVFFGVHVVGREHLLGLDRFVLISNHNSHLDVALLFYLLPVRRIGATRTVAAREYFSRSRIGFRLVDFLFRPIWVSRGQIRKHDTSVDQIKRALDAGESVIVFPEGTRGEAGEMGAFKSGIGRLMAERTEVPVVPVFLSGPERSMPRHTSVPLPLWNHVLVGPPQNCTGRHAEITQSLEATLTDLAASEMATRRRRGPREARREPPPVVVAFLGMDGSGKSTLSRRAAEELSRAATVCLISDRLQFYERGALKEMQPLLTERVRRTLSDYAKRAKSLKGYKIPKLTELLLRDRLLEQVKRWHRPRYVVQDGSPLLNMIAWAALYRAGGLDQSACSRAISVLTGRVEEVSRHDSIFRDFPILTALRVLRLNHLHLPDAVLLIDLDPETACTRIEERGGEKQPHENPEHLAQLRRAYQTVCRAIQSDERADVAVLSGEEPAEMLVRRAMERIKSVAAKRDST